TTITITAVGGTVTLTHVQLRARPVPVARTVKVSSADPVSIQRHGQRSNPDDAPWAGQHDAFAIAQLLLAHYAQRRPTVELRLVSSDHEHLMQILTRTISDMITISHGELGLSANFHVESIEHTIARMPSLAEADAGCEKRVHYATLGCERTGLVVPRNPFTFDEAGAGFDDGVLDPTAADDPDAERGCETRVPDASLRCERTGLVVPSNPFPLDEAGAGFDDGVSDPTPADDPDAVVIFDHPTQGQFNTGRFGT